MRKLIIPLLLVLIGCMSEGIRKEKQLSDTEIEILNNYSVRLTKSIQNLEYDLIRTSWSHDAFKKRVGRLIKSDPTVFNYIYDQEIKVKVSMANVDLINKQKYENGRLFHIKTEFLKNHAEVTYLLLFENAFKFIKYRIELIDGKPTLTDSFIFEDNIWQSQNMANLVRLNKRYLAGSNERSEANIVLMNHERALKSGDTLAALRYLDEMPKTHQIGNWVSLMRIRCAQAISDTVFLSVLESEKNKNNSIYLDYLYAYFSNDSTELDKIFRYLKQQVGIKEELIEVIEESNLFWN